MAGGDEGSGAVGGDERAMSVALLREPLAEGRSDALELGRGDIALPVYDRRDRPVGELSAALRGLSARETTLERGDSGRTKEGAPDAGRTAVGDGGGCDFEPKSAMHLSTNTEKRKLEQTSR